MSFMMRPKDSLTLAFTKLRVRRIRLVITLVVMSLLFAGLVFLSVITAGVTQSLHTFGKEGLGGRYMVSALPVTYQPYDNQDLVAALEQSQKDLIAQKTSFAKKHNLPYDAKTDPTLPLITEQIGPNPTDTKLIANISSSLAEAALRKLNETLPVSYEDFTAIARQNQATATYQATTPSYSTRGADIQVLKDGKEDYSNEQKQTFGSPNGLESITSLGWNQMSDELLKPFLLEGQTVVVGSDGSIPITTPFSAAEQLMGLNTLPATANSQKKLDRLAAVRKGVAGKLATICYRNPASRDLLQRAVSQIAEINANKNKPNYGMPSLQYALPAEACGPVTIKKDTRSTEEKRADNVRAALDAVSNADTAPIQGIFTVRIVGITADSSTLGTSLDAGGLLSSILSSNLGQGWLSPISAFQPGALPTKAQGGHIADRAVSQRQYFAEFGSLTEARKFIDRYNCSPQQAGDFTGPNSYIEACKKAGTYFSVSPYGNNAGAIDDFKRNIWKVARYVLIAVIIIATVVLMGTLGKVVADSRRETAVFRALGARRLHVSQVYLLYTVIVGLMITAISLVVGIIGAAIVGYYFEPRLSVAAVLAYNSRDIHQHFSLFGLDATYLVAIGLIVIGTSLLAATIPLLSNMRRNPIRDMRDE